MPAANDPPASAPAPPGSVAAEAHRSGASPERPGPRHMVMVSRQFDYWLTVYQRTWRGSVFNSFVTPVLYLVAMGMLLGRFVDDSGARLPGATTYLHFVAPGLLAAHAMQIAMGEVLWPVMGMVKWNKTYFSMIATPLRVVDVFGAHMAFVAFRIATTCAVFMLALVPFGLYASWPGVVLAFAVQLLIGLAFATPFFGVAAWAKSDSVFSVIMRIVVTPLFLFSGAFFPVSNLAAPLQVAAQLTPLYHGVELTRAFMLAPWGAIDWPMMAGHAAYLLAIVVVGAAWATRRLERRLIS